MSQRNRRQYPSVIEDNAKTPLIRSPSTSKSSPTVTMNSNAYQTFPSNNPKISNGGSHLPTSVVAPINTSNIPSSGIAVSRQKPKQPNRTTKTSQKLKLFPEEEDQSVYMPETLTTDVYTQLAQIPHGSARIEAERLSNMNREELPRVTAYCTAS